MRPRTAPLALFVLALAAGAAPPAAAQAAATATAAPEPSASGGARKGRTEVGAHIGLSAATLADTAFALGAHADHFLTEQMSVGPLVQFAVDDPYFQLGLSLQVKGTLPIPEIPKLAPSAEIGIGFLYAWIDPPGRNPRDDVSFLIPLGLGVQYEVAERVSVGTNVYFNFTDVFDDNFFFTWFVGASYRF